MSMDTLVINLSQHILSADEMSVLARGPSYVPTLNFDDFGLEVDLFKFERLLNLKSFFSHRTTETMPPTEPPGTDNLALPIEPSGTVNSADQKGTKLTNVWSSKQLSFLDVLISQENGEFHTDLYRKDTDRNALLRADSHHPPSLINALPFSQKVRVSRITSRQDKLAPAMDDLRERFTKRGYTPAVLDAALNREVIPNRATKDEKRIVFSTTYNRASNLVRFTIRKHWHLLQNDEVLAASCQTPPLIAYRRGRNLSDNLIHADNKDHYHTPHFLEGGKQGNFRCMNCSVCNSLTTGDVFCHPHSGKKITIHNRITCRSTFVVYIIRCPCGLVYVGKTTRMLKHG
ncbi:uncharacterized protein LOC142490608 [Ascaphus truei]|uniref:uncharacterized protein LOC142490608 n=1 Tax=Ascaphus truei TaxID=8439 RepID=UPI003F5AA791